MNLLKKIKLMKLIQVAALCLVLGPALASVPSGRHVIINKNSGKVLDVAGYSQANGANVLQWSQGDGLNQRWDVQDLGNGYYSILAAHSGKSMDVEGWNPDSGANLAQYDYYGFDIQQWTIEEVGSGYYKIISKYSGKAVDVTDISTANGANIQLWDYWGGDGQLWSFVPVGTKTAQQIVAEMGAGWNLGNTLDATGGETSWGNPLTQDYMIQSVAAQGFGTIRIPVTWEAHFTDSAHTIDSAWLNRVETLVDVAIDAGLYVIINVHHDEWVEPTYAARDETIATLQTVWTQIAAHFKDHSQKLIFETLNEPRANKGTSLEWSGTAENYEVVNDLNQAALSTIRSSGGNNGNRLVMIPGYAAAPWEDMVSQIEVPADSMIAISTHGYVPYSFTEQEVADGGDATFDSGESDLIDYIFDSLNTRFVSQGIPVVMGEWGTVDKGNTSDRAAYAQYYQQKAQSVGIPTIVWDNNALGGTGHNYRLYDRAANQWVFPTIVQSIVNP